MYRPKTAGIIKNQISSPKRQKLPKVSDEKLMQQSIQQSQTMNLLQNEQKVLMQQYSLIQMQKQRMAPQEQNSQSWLGIKLKIQINQLTSQIEEKQNQIRLLKKNPNYTRAQESAILIDYLNHCSQQLKTEQQLMPNEAEDLKLEIQELEVQKKLLEEQSENLSIQKGLQEKKISTHYMELDSAKAEIKERERILRYLKKEMQKFEEKKEPQQQKVQVKVVDLDDKKAEIIEKDQIITQQEHIISNLKEKLQERTNYELNSKNQLIDELQGLQETISIMRQELKDLNDQYNQEIQPLEIDQLPIIQGNRDHTFTILHDQYNKQEKKYPRAPRVKFEQVEDMGKEIGLRLQLKQISIEEAIVLLVGQQNVISVSELQEQILQEPFTVADPSDAKLIARYMVEDGSEEWATLDPDSNCKVSIVKSVFRHLVGCYKLLTSEQDKQYWDEVSAIVNKFEAALRQQFELMAKNQQFIKPQDLFYCLDQLFLELTDQQKEYVLLRLFAYTNNINKIMYSKIFDVFKAGSYIDRILKDTRKKKARKQGKKVQVDDE